LERGPQDSSYSESFSAESFIDAIEDFQSFAGLKKTGKVIAPVSRHLHLPSGLFFYIKRQLCKDEMFSKNGSQVNLIRRRRN
jgi:hypothetical protein